MSSDPTPASRPLLIRFCDSFLQERNIKWMLAVGMLILLGSSLLLVNSHWEETDPLWKYLIFLTYTAGIFGAGEWTRHRLALRRTGTVLQALTVLLLPISFLVLHWFQQTDEGVIQGAIHLGLVGVNLAFAWTAARRIFHHWLRGHQPTFLASYLILALAGAVAPRSDSAWAPWLALALWAVFTAGTVKVSRHVFWLTEEHRKPRIFGFFPIALLGSQFLLLFALQVAPHVALPWLGLGCVLVALPVLLTADTVARVFQQRTGDLVRPLPWSIIGPLGLGLVLCAVGVVLSGLSVVPPDRPQALVLSAALAAVMLAVVARRTGKQAFVWAMLAAVMLAYNFSPAFFADLGKALLNEGARIVQEERLPYAFYGLTYLPLLIGGMFATRLLARANTTLFAQPLRCFCVGLACVMLVISFGHVKAWLPVALCMTAIFAVQVNWFRDGRLAILAIAAWLAAALGFVAFGSEMFRPFWSFPTDSVISCVALAIGVLFVVGHRVDRFLEKLLPAAWAESGEIGALCRRSLCQSASLVLTVALAAFWLGRHSLLPLAPDAWLASGLVAALLIVQAIRWAQPSLGAAAILFAQAVLLAHAFAGQLAIGSLLTLATALFLGQWLLGYVLERFPRSRLSRTFAEGNYQVSCIWLTLALVGLYLPLCLLDMARMIPGLPAFVALPLLEISWPCRLLVLVWAFDAARREASSTWTTLGCLGVLGLVGAALANQLHAESWQWLPVAWATVALAALPIAELLHRRLQRLQWDEADDTTIARHRALAMPLTYVILGVLALVAVGSLVAFSWPLRLAGALGLCGLVVFSVLRRRSEIRLPSLILANWQAIALTVLLTAPQLQSILDLNHKVVLDLCVPLALVASVSLFLWQLLSQERSSPWLEMVTGHVMSLRLLTLAAVGFSLQMPALAPVDILLAAAAFLFQVSAELVSACRQQREERVWIALAVALLAALYFVFFGVVLFGRGTTMFVVLGLGLTFWVIGEWARGWERLSILTRPLQQAALAMPLATVAIGIYRHIQDVPPAWLGHNSLALLFAAGFYFWRGLERPSKPFLILAGVILNIALILLWGELAWSDPQFFMIPIGISILALVQLLRQEIPERFHDPLRYLGALVILVSPTFHIVGKSWVPLLSLMVVSVGVVLLSIGLRVRALMYMGTAFLVADLVAMLVRGSIDNANVLWIAGLGLGGAVLMLAAYCERNREALVERMRVLGEMLKQWD